MSSVVAAYDAEPDLVQLYVYALCPPLTVISIAPLLPPAQDTSVVPVTVSATGVPLLHAPLTGWNPADALASVPTVNQGVDVSMPDTLAATAVAEVTPYQLHVAATVTAPI